MVAQTHICKLYSEELPTTKHEINFGEVNKIEEQFKISITQEGLIGSKTEKAICMDAGGVKGTITLNFSRVCPNEPIDSYNVEPKYWSNGFWHYNVTKYFVDRWQMRTDGCKFTFDVLDEEGNHTSLYPALTGINCYVSGYSSGYSLKHPWIMNGSVSLNIGSIRNQNDIQVIKYVTNFEGPDSPFRGIGLEECSYIDTQVFSKYSVDAYQANWKQYVLSYLQSHPEIHIDYPPGFDWNKIWYCTNSFETQEQAIVDTESHRRNCAYYDAEHKDDPDYTSLDVSYLSKDTVIIYARYTPWDKSKEPD